MLSAFPRLAIPILALHGVKPRPSNNPMFPVCVPLPYTFDCESGRDKKMVHVVENTWGSHARGQHEEHKHRDRDARQPTQPHSVGASLQLHALASERLTFPLRLKLGHAAP